MYESMKLRGFNGRFNLGGVNGFESGSAKRIGLRDGLYLTGWVAVFGVLLIIR